MASLGRLLLVLAAVAPAAASPAGIAVASARERALLQTWGRELDGTQAGEKDTPVTRVVKLLKDMAQTLDKEMNEDEDLYHKLACWCNSNNYEKDQAISASTAKIAELESSIDSLGAKSSELKLQVKELESEAAADRQSLGEATAIRDKQLKAFHGQETDAIQAVSQLKAAIVVLSKHHAAPPDSTVAGGPVFKSEKDSWSSFLSTKAKAFPWEKDHDESEMMRSLDDFMQRNGYDETPAEATPPAQSKPIQKFLQQGGAAAAADTAQSQEWSSSDTAVVRRALKAATVFMQAHHSETYMPAYSAQSGEIMGVLQQLKDEMEADLSDSQKEEQARAAAFAELREAKTAEIENGEKMAEQKEDQLANTVNALAEAKEDLAQESAVLSEDQRFLMNLKETCEEASKNFNERKNARMEEIKAVSEAVQILQGDEARDAMSGTYSFVQVSSKKQVSHSRQEAAEVIRDMAKKTHNPTLSILATSVELDAFGKVKKAIDDMVAMLKEQQSMEVKKSDWCKSEFHENEVATAKTTDHKGDLEAKSSELGSNIKALEDGIADAKAQIAQQQLDLQRASENRKAENMDFQKTIADQLVTIEVLKKALDKLAKYYDFVQTKNKAEAGSQRQTPPVPQMEYSANKGSVGVMEMIEKLIGEAKILMNDSKKSESNAQAAYEQMIGDTNASVRALSKDVMGKTKAKGRAHKDLLQTESDLSDTNKELEGLAKYNGDIHGECDYLLKNFEVRQQGRGQEIEALQQAKQILSGAELSG